MKSTVRSRLLASTLFVGAASVAAPALAQVAVPSEATSPASTVTQTATAPDQENAAQQQGDIVVTGSLIKNPNLVSASPVTTVGSDEIDLKQSNTAEQLLRELPGVVPSIGSAVNNGNGGASFVDLRGLGSNRNIVLLDGNRIAPAGLVGRVDLNNIPLALVDRVDVQTGAAVTTYGADAITGVVNFITKKDFTGAEISASQQITEKGDGNIFRVDATIGGNFADGKGNAVVSIGYQEADPVYQGARDFSNNNIDSYTGAIGGSGTAIPSRFTGTRGLVGGVPSTTAAFVQTGTTAAGVPILAAVPTGAVNGAARQIDPATGQAIANYATFNFNPYNIFQTPFERYNIFAQGNYQVSDNLEVYTRGLFSRNKVQTIIAPSGVFNSAITVNLNNPLLPAALRNQLCAFNVAPTVSGVTAAGVAVSGQATYVPRFTPAQCAAAATATGATDPNYRTVSTNIARRTTEVGPRISEYATTIFDYRLGLRGKVTNTLDFDLGASYGQSQNIQTIRNYVLTSRARQGALVNGTAANPVCADTSNGCVPVNFFGAEGSISPAAAAFLTANSTSTNTTGLGQVRGVISGDLGFALPSAVDAIGVAVGGEYRHYTASQSSDLLAQTPGELGGAGGAAPNINGGFEVYEAFGELIAPLVQDKPFFKSLTLEAGARYSYYKIDAAGKPTNDTFTWKAGGTWEPVDSLKLRGNFSRAVRAPNISELFSPLSTGLTNLQTDPCAGAAPTTNANLRAVCLAQGAPAGTIGSIANPTAAQANITSGGSLTLRPETANTYTFGAVFQPSFLPRFTLTVDYYNIKVKDVIGAPLPGDLVNACFPGGSGAAVTAASATSAACTVIRRNPATGGLDGDPATTGGLFAPLSNLGRLETDGIDVAATYSHDLGFAKLALGFNGNWTAHSKYQATSSSVNRECVGFYSINCSFTGSIQPKFQFSQRSTLTLGAVDFSLLWRYIHPVDFEPAQAAADIAGGGSTVLDQFRHIPAEHYFDLSARVNATDQVTFTVTALNLFNNQPTLVGSTVGSTTFNSGNVYPSTYDALGRRFAVGAKMRF